MSHLLRVLTVVLLVAFGLVVLTVHAHLWQTTDLNILLATQSALPRATDFPSSILSLVGTAEVTLVVFGLLVLLAPSSQRLPLVVTMGLVTLIELAGKAFISQPHLPHELNRYVFHIPIPSGTIRTSFSFPSGHAARTTFLAIVWANWIASTRWHPFIKTILYTLWCVFDIVMLVSRVYLAEHWFTDVLGGALLGGAFALIAMQWQFDLAQWLKAKFNPCR